MIDKEQIHRWLQEGLITQDQAKKMLLDVTQRKEEKTSNKITIALSIIGSLFLGVGAILFVASNWESIPNVIRIALLVGSTFTAYTVGYLFKYKLQNLPIIGASLFFLGSLLFGATIFLIAQMYHVNANSYSLVLIWLIGILPLVYAFLSTPITLLSIVLSYLCIGLFLGENNNALLIFGRVTLLFPNVYLLVGVLLFSFGSLHYFSKRLTSIARMYRLAGINTVMFCLFFLSFKFAHHRWYSTNDLATLPSFFLRSFDKFLENPITKILFIGILLCSLLIFLFFFINARYNPSKSKTNLLENSVITIATLSSLLCLFVGTTTSLYLLLFNLILLSLIFLLILLGYKKEDVRLVNIGMLWLFAFITARYFDFFWNLMIRSVFFIIGGLILVAFGILLERKRRELKTDLEKTEKHNPFELSRKKYLFLFFGLFWFVIIGGYIVIKEHLLRTGQEVTLKVQPVDPRDLFRGDYVILSYDISRLDTNTLPSEKTDFKIDDPVFVELTIEDGYAEASSIESQAPKKDALFIRGKVKRATDSTLWVEYGIESYFVPEYKGLEIEKEGQKNKKNIDAKVVINKSGKAMIKSLLIDGQELKRR